MMQLAPGTDIKVMLVKGDQGHWRVCLRTADDKLETWSNEVFESRDAAEAAVDAWLGELAASGATFERVH